MRPRFFEHRLKLTAHAVTRLRIEGAEGLVQEEDLGIAGNRPGERHALTLSAGKRGGPMAAKVGDAKQFQSPLDAAGDLRAGDMARPQARRPRSR